MKTLGVINPTDRYQTYSDSVGTLSLAAATGAAVDVPAQAHFLQAQSDAPFWIRYGSTAASIPSSSSTASSTNSEYVPLAAMPLRRNIGSTLTTTGISIIAPTTGIVSLQWFN